MSRWPKTEVRRRWSIDIGGGNYIAYDLDDGTFQIGGISYFRLSFESMDKITAFVAEVRKELDNAVKE